jgi:hypothetical protein
MALDSKRGIICCFGALNATNTVFYQTTGTGNNAYAPTTSGSGPSGGSGSVVWDSINDRFVVWSNSGQTLWTLTPPATNPYSGGNAWTWSTLATGGVTPSVEAGLAAGDGSGSNTGTYGRFQFVPNPAITGYILLNRVTDQIYFYRP